MKVDAIQLYNDVKADGQLKNFWSIHQEALKSDGIDFNDLKQEIYLKLQSFLLGIKKNPEACKWDELQLLKTANIVIQNVLLKQLHSATKFNLKVSTDEIFWYGRDPDLPPTDLIQDLIINNIIEAGSDEEKFLRYRLIDGLNFRAISAKMGKNLRTLSHVIRINIIKKLDKAFFYSNQSICLTDLIPSVIDMDNEEETGELAEEALTINEDQEPEILWTVAREILSDVEYKILYQILYCDKSQLEVAQHFGQTQQNISLVYLRALDKLRKKLKKELVK